MSKLKNVLKLPPRYFLLIAFTHLFSASANGIVEMANRAKVMTRQISEAI
jgi:hypothetical protein